MSSVSSTPERYSLDTLQTSKSHRVLACVLCQQRKVKCDRKAPCANCVKHETQCVPATQARRRKRRFPERELLDRLRRYEDLLRKNNIEFNPVHDGAVSTTRQVENDGHLHTPAASTPAASESAREVKNIWQAMSDGNRSLNDAVQDILSRKAWDHSDDQGILLGSRMTAVDLSTIHPEPTHIFRLWQIYLDNVDPLLKVTHPPSLQPRIIEAAANLSHTRPAMEALMFGIYLIAIISINDGNCRTYFALSREELLTKYRFGCQQALLNAGFLRTCDRDCLTALYFYLVSIQSITDPSSLFSMLGIAIRIAQRMGLQNESTYSRCSILDAEMSRRLWWSLVLFDGRISEMTDSKSTMLNPTWDCKPPHNLNDTDLRAEMKQLPDSQSKSTEALFVVMRSTIGEYVRQAKAHLDFTMPALKPIVGGSSLDILEEKIEGRLRLCDMGNPIHYMTTWITRGSLARYRLLEHYASHSSTCVPQTDSKRDVAMSFAFTMLDCDTKIMTSSLTKKYQWFMQLHFPFPAYIHIVLDLQRRLDGKLARQAWEVMSDNFDARFELLNLSDSRIMTKVSAFTKVVLQAWEAVEVVYKHARPGNDIDVPRIVAKIRKHEATIAHATRIAQTGQVDMTMLADFNDIPTEFPMCFADYSLNFGTSAEVGTPYIASSIYTHVPEEALMTNGMNKWNWSSLD